MITLAADTSTVTASCAVAEDGKVLSELSIQYGKTHSQKILPMLKNVLAMLDKTFQDVDLFSVTTGPGSFTGLRIGAVTIKGLAYALQKPVCGIPTLDVLAYAMPDFKGIIVPMLDARNNQVYASLYRKKNSKLDQISPVAGVHIEKLIEEMQNTGEDILMTGDAVPLHIQKIKDVLGGKIIETQSALSFPRASCCALMAERAYYENKAVSAFGLKPVYYRKSQAERMKELSGRG